MADSDKKSTTLESVKRDGWENTITAIGTSRDKRTGGRVVRTPPNVTYREFEDLFFSDDLAATAAELPAREMVRQWITINANDPSTIESKGGRTEADDQSTEEKISLANKTLNRLDELEAQAKVFEALVWARVFGGSLLFLGADDGGGDNPEAMQEPLNEDKIQSFTHMTVFDRWDVHIHERYNDMMNPKHGQPKLYRINATTLDGNLAAGDGLIHESRFIRFDGVLTNLRRLKENGGWSDSIYGRTKDLIRDYGLAWHGIANLVQDFSQAVFKMRGLKDAILTDKDNLVARRMTLMDMCRSIARAIPIDAEEEEFKREATPVSGLPELMDRFGLRMSSAFRMPATLLFGQSPAGLQSTGKSDIQFFYDQIKAQQETTLRPKVERLVRLVFLAKDGPTGGKEPEDWSFIFNPLYQLDEIEEAERRHKQAQTDQVYLQEGVVSEDEVSFSRFGGDRYSTETVLDLEQRAEDDLAKEAEPEPVPPVMPVPVPVAIPPQPEPDPGNNEPGA